MKAIAIANAVAISLLLVSTAQAANVFKYTFTADASYPTELVTIRAGVKVVKRSTVTVCSYFGPSDQYLGQYQATDNTLTDETNVEEYCLANYENRS